MQRAKDANAPQSNQLTISTLEVKMSRLMFQGEVVAQSVKLF